MRPSPDGQTSAPRPSPDRAIGDPAANTKIRVIASKCRVTKSAGGLRRICAGTAARRRKIPRRQPGIASPGHRRGHKTEARLEHAAAPGVHVVDRGVHAPVREHLAQVRQGRAPVREDPALVRGRHALVRQGPALIRGRHALVREGPALVRGVHAVGREDHGLVLEVRERVPEVRVPVLAHHAGARVHRIERIRAAAAAVVVTGDSTCCAVQPQGRPLGCRSGGGPGGHVGGGQGDSVDQTSSHRQASEAFAARLRTDDDR
jgi:hypothetical protein